MTKRALIQREVEAYLRSQPDCKALLSDVVACATKKVQCPKTTVYRYISELTTLKKELVAGRWYCTMKETGMLAFGAKQLPGTEPAGLDYTLALRRLREVIDQVPHKDEFYILEARLKECLHNEYLYGPQSVPGEKTRIVSSLDQFVRKHNISESFADLCQE